MQKLTTTPNAERIAVLTISHEPILANNVSVVPETVASIVPPSML